MAEIKHYSSITDMRRSLNELKLILKAAREAQVSLDVLASITSLDSTSATSMSVKPTAKIAKRLKSPLYKEQSLSKVTESMGNLRACYDCVSHMVTQINNEFSQDEHIVSKVLTEVLELLAKFEQAIADGLEKSTQLITLPKPYAKQLDTLIADVGKCTNIAPITGTLFSEKHGFTSYLNIGAVTDRNNYRYDQFYVVMSAPLDLSQFKITTLNRFHEPGTFTLGLVSPTQVANLLKTFNIKR